MNAPAHLTAELSPALLRQIGAMLRAGQLIPYLGPIAPDTGGAAPMSLAELAAYFSRRVALPKRARGNPWASAQYIEAHRHRSTLDALMREAFVQAPHPAPLHRLFAAFRPPLIVDSWYDDAMRSALAQSGGWGEIQGISRARIGEARWYRFYDSQGNESDAGSAALWRTVLYRPHGGHAPAGHFLISDADYVEVLTELDIQSPIPDAVKARRTGRGFLFVGCRFDDQLLRSYARQVLKRSQGPHFAIVSSDMLSRNEMRFLETQNITAVSAAVEQFTCELSRICA